MKVAFVIRSSARNGVGGDFVQYEETARELKLLGVEVDTYFADEVIDYPQYSLLHFFNLIRPADILRHIDRTETPYVVSTIFVEYRMKQRSSRLILDSMEYIKYLARVLLRHEPRISWRYLFMGHRRSIAEVAGRARVLLPNSDSEGRRVREYLGSAHPLMRTVPNGVNTDRFDRAQDNPKFEGTVVCVGLFEPRKNQLKVVQALTELGYPSCFVGSPARDPHYYQQCREAAGSNIQFLQQVSRDDLASIFRSARVHVLASYFETTGLVSLEAAYAGCNIVTTERGDQHDYFEGISFVCDPDSADSIKAAIRAAYEQPRGALNGKDVVAERYTWKRAAEVTLLSYKKALENETTA